MTENPSLPGPGPQPDNGPQPESSEVEQLVFQCLEASDIDLAIEELRHARPDRIAAVESAVNTLRQQGLLETTRSSTPEAIPERLGPFRLLKQLGAGGMGVVYLAEQEDLRRQVAVKLIRPEHLFFPGSRERFRREVEAVASLQHASIAPIFTVGEDNSLPYFSMEYVDGPSLGTLLTRLSDKAPTSITSADVRAAIHGEDHQPSASHNASHNTTQNATQNATTTRRSVLPHSWIETCLGFCVSIGEALQHAHERGVLHRDVKPSNILVTQQGQVKLVDFGLARSEGAQPMTASSSQIGSLPYVPPEHLDGASNIPSVRQDIYALAVTLYELLTKTSPFLRESAAATREAIRDGKPTPLRSCNANVSWDLETVCMKAMSADPAQRYATMADFVHDLENVRNKRPILAKRPGVWIRLRRWEQRHPTLTAVTGVAVLLTAAAAITLALFESSARKESDRLKVAADRRATEALEVTDFLVELFQFASPDKSLGEDMPVGMLLQQGADRIQTGLQNQPQVTARLQATFGRVYSWLGEADKAASFFALAAEQFERLHGEGHREALECRLQQADNQIKRGEYEVAEQLLQATEEQLKRNQPIGGTIDPPIDPTLHNELKRKRSHLAHVRGDAATAERLLQEVLADCRTRPDDLRELCISRHLLAVFFQNENRHDEANQQFQLSVKLSEKSYPKGHPTRIEMSRRAAETLAAIGQFQAADSICSKALADSERVFGANHPRTATVLGSLSSIHRESGKLELAATEMERANQIIRRYRDASKNYFARSLNDLAVSYYALGRFAEARDLYVEALVASREAFPGDHELTAGLLCNLSQALVELNDLKGAHKHMTEATEMTKRLDPESRALARLLNGMALIYITQGSPKWVASAEELLAQAIEQATPWKSETWELARAHALRAYLNNLRNNGAVAEKEAKIAIELYDQVRRADHTLKALAIYNIAWAMLGQGKSLDEAEPYFQRSIAMYERMQQGYTDKAFPLSHYGVALTPTRPQEALAPLKEAVAIRRRLLPKNAGWRLTSEANLAKAYMQLNDFENAEPLLLAVHKGLEEVTSPGSPQLQASAKRLINLYQRWQKPEKAKQYKALLK